MKVGIINITGYAGMELARILHHHPEAEIVSVTGRSAAGNQLGEVLPHLADLKITVQPELSGTLDVVFSALPQVASAEACVPLVKSGIKVIDISADFRLKDPEAYKEWYNADHPSPDLLKESVYGLTELNKDEISSANLIANPGCYPTGAILALAPVIKEGLVREKIIIDAKSGVSGAGRGFSLGTHFSEVNENVFPYATDGHRHLPEITQELSRMKDQFNPKVIFTPHLIPMTRGILDSIYVDFTDNTFSESKTASETISTLYRDFYRDSPFIKVMDVPPQTKHTWGNNNCLIFPKVDHRTGQLVVFAALDNLVKGAAGQAVQNMNLMFNLPEESGLEGIAIYP